MQWQIENSIKQRLVCLHMYATWSDLPSDKSTKGMTRLLPPNGNISSVTELKVKLGLDNAVM